MPEEPLGTCNYHRGPHKEITDQHFPCSGTWKPLAGTEEGRPNKIAAPLNDAAAPITPGPEPYPLSRTKRMELQMDSNTAGTVVSGGEVGPQTAKQFYQAHYAAYDDGNIDAEDMCEFAEAYAAEREARRREQLELVGKTFASMESQHNQLLESLASKDREIAQLRKHIAIVTRSDDRMNERHKAESAAKAVDELAEPKHSENGA